MVAIRPDKTVAWLSSQYKFDVISLRKDVMQEKKKVRLAKMHAYHRIES